MTSTNDMSHTPSPRHFLIDGCRCDECVVAWDRYKNGEIPYDPDFMSHLERDYFQGMIRIRYDGILRERAERKLARDEEIAAAMTYCKSQDYA